MNATAEERISFQMYCVMCGIPIEVSVPADRAEFLMKVNCPDEEGKFTHETLRRAWYRQAPTRQKCCSEKCYASRLHSASVNR